MGAGASAGEHMRIGKSGSRFTGLKARARPCLHPLPTVDLLAGWLPGATFSGRAAGKVPWLPCTLGSLAQLAENGPLAGAHVLPRFSSVAAIWVRCW